MNMPLEIKVSLDTQVPVEKARAQLLDTEGSIRLFPKLRRVTKLADNFFLWEMQELGAAGVSHAVAYAARYVVDGEKLHVKWTSEKGHGNSMINGEWRFVQKPGGVLTLDFSVKGELRDIDVPFLLRPAAPTFIKKTFASLMNRYLEKVRDAALARP